MEDRGGIEMNTLRLMILAAAAAPLFAAGGTVRLLQKPAMNKTSIVFSSTGAAARSLSALPSGTPSEIGRSFAMRARLRSTARIRGVGTRQCCVLANACQ